MTDLLEVGALGMRERHLHKMHVAIILENNCLHYVDKNGDTENVRHVK
jgi:hypothetical protein